MRVGQYVRCPIIFEEDDIKYPRNFVLGKIIDINSISEIARVIKSAKLTPDQVNIICSNTEGNKARLQKLTRDMFGSGSKVKYLIGKIPLPSKGETNKTPEAISRVLFVLGMEKSND